ncbi:hypothetical protein QL996_04780 [Planococcus sp. APC 4015]|nr:hypothetical protein [Planococcus sp. APC 4015]
MTVSPRSRIGIVVTDAYSAEDPDHDTPLLLAALRERAVDADAVVWHAHTEDLADYDLLVIRSPWDYPERPAEFHAWLDRAEAATRVLNSPATVRWNLDKQYLRALEDTGIRIVPTTWCRTITEVHEALSALGHRRIVVKPAVSAGARDTGLFDAADPRAVALADRIVAAGGVAMIQPEIPELSEGAEKALYAINGHHTHTIAKGALLEVGGGLIGGVYVENPQLVDATDEEHAFAEAVLRAVTAVTDGAMPLYARVDVVDSAEFGVALLEVELVEPALNLHIATHATAVVADAIVAELGRG